METATLQKGSKTKTLAASTLPETVTIKWHRSHNNKVTAGDQRFRAYKDRKTGMIRELVDPKTGEPKVFVVFAYKDFKLNISGNPWHKAVYEFLLGDTQPGGEWMGHERLNPKRKLLYMVNATEEAKKNNITRREIRNMELKVEEMSAEKLMLFGFLFGAEGKDMTYDDVLNAVIELINTPAHTEGVMYSVKDVKEKLEDVDLNYYMLVAAMIIKKVLVFKDGVYRYENSGIAVDQQGVVMWLKDQPTIYASLKSKYFKDDLATDSGSSKS